MTNIAILAGILLLILNGAIAYSTSQNYGELREIVPDEVDSIRFDENITLQYSKWRNTQFYDDDTRKFHVLGASPPPRGEIMEFDTYNLIVFELDDKNQITMETTYEGIFKSSHETVRGVYFDGSSYWTLEVQQYQDTDRIFQISINLLNFNYTQIISNQTIEIINTLEISAGFDGRYSVDLLKVENNHAIYAYDLHLPDDLEGKERIFNKINYYSINDGEVVSSFSNLAGSYESIHYSKSIDQLVMMYTGTYRQNYNYDKHNVDFPSNQALLLVTNDLPSPEDKDEFNPKASINISNRYTTTNTLKILPQFITNDLLTFLVFDWTPNFVGYDIYPIKDTPHNLTFGIFGIGIIITAVIVQQVRNSDKYLSQDETKKVNYIDK